MPDDHVMVDVVSIRFRESRGKKVTIAAVAHFECYSLTISRKCNGVIFKLIKGYLGE